MRITSIEIAFLTIPTLIHAVSLADMKPRAENLPEGCDNIYTQQIQGCTERDFETLDCTQQCFSALKSLVQPIYDACQGVTGQNLIVAYLAGSGPEQICNSVKEPSGGSRSSQPPSSSSVTTTVIKTTKTSGTMIVSTKTDDTSSLLVDTSSTLTAGGSASETGASDSSALPDQLNTNDHSGGGSPFDTPGNMSGAASLSFSIAITLLSATAFAFTNFR